MPKIRVAQYVHTTSEGRPARPWAYHCPACTIMRIHDEATPWQAVLVVARDHARTCSKSTQPRSPHYTWSITA